MILYNKRQVIRLSECLESLGYDSRVFSASIHITNSPKTGKVFVTWKVFDPEYRQYREDGRRARKVKRVAINTDGILEVYPPKPEKE